MAGAGHLAAKASANFLEAMQVIILPTNAVHIERHPSV